MILRVILFSSLAILSTSSLAQQCRVYTLRNCQGELRTATFQDQIKMFWKFVSHHSKLSEQRLLNFSPGYILDTPQFEKQIEGVRKTLPVNYFTTLDFLGDWLENVPEEKGIWFMQVFAEKDSKGNYKVYSAIKIIFDGTDARISQQRTNPKITDVVFIFRKDQLDQLAIKLKSCPETVPR